jgi:transposase
MSETMNIRSPQSNRKRHFTLEQKLALLRAAAAAGSSISQVGRQHGIAPSLLFQWRKAMENGEEKGLEAGEDVVPASQLKQAEARIRELERMLGKKTMENEILQEAVKIAREKKLISPGKLPRRGGGR